MAITLILQEVFEMPDELIFLWFLLIACGVLQIILFFKIWGMTNDVRALKNDYFEKAAVKSELLSMEEIRTNLILGNTGRVKKILLSNFISRVDESFDNLSRGFYQEDEDGAGQWISMRKENLNTSIRPFVNTLEKQFAKIGEELPPYIKNLQTYNDYFNLFTKEDFEVQVEKQPQENNE